MQNQRSLIVLIEDDPNDATLFRRALRKSGCDADVTVLEDGDAAFRWFRQLLDPPSAEKAVWPRMVLLDIKMPRTSGLEVLEWLRRQPALGRLPVIAFTSSREREDILRAYQSGANSYLVKPVSFDQLKELVRSLHHYWMDWNEQGEPA
ncbi:MAG: response regulator [Anaerolineales bacterium]|nr:response regulator [Anaerolineales bacterium]